MEKNWAFYFPLRARSVACQYYKSTKYIYDLNWSIQVLLLTRLTTSGVSSRKVRPHENQNAQDLFFADPMNHELLIRRVEIIRTFIHLLTALQEHKPHLDLKEFLGYMDRLEAYGHEIPLAVFAPDRPETGAHRLAFYS